MEQSVMATDSLCISFLIAPWRLLIVPGVLIAILLRTQWCVDFSAAIVLHLFIVGNAVCKTFGTHGNTRHD